MIRCKKYYRVDLEHYYTMKLTTHVENNPGLLVWRLVTQQHVKSDEPLRKLSISCWKKKSQIEHLLQSEENIFTN